MHQVRLSRQRWYGKCGLGLRYFTDAAEREVGLLMHLSIARYEQLIWNAKK